jgi:3-hydroxybutyryl-CoA dehydrogenase
MGRKINIGIVGLGLMGRSITTCILAAGHNVTAVTNERSREGEARAQISGYLGQMRAEGILKEEPETLIGNLTITDDFSLLAHHEIVIESIVEDIDAKKAVYEQLEKVVSPAAIIGSNTSSIPVTFLQSGMRNPERLLGIHWAEPAHVTRFIEIICGDKTDIRHGYRIVELSETWGKEPSLLRKDIRGFITNRLMYAMMREGFHLIENGYASIEDIDRACRNDLGYWITFAGPFRFMDLTGIPAYLTVMKDLFPELSNAEQAPGFIEKLVSSGAKGVSNARGFYSYTPESAAKWEKLFLEFTYDIRKLAEKYPHNAGDIGS